MKQILLLIMSVVMVGCVAANNAEIDRFVSQNNRNLQSLKIGMSKDEVRKVMSQGKTTEKFPGYARRNYTHRIEGSPMRVEAYKAGNGGVMEFWMYYTMASYEHKGSGDKNYTPVCFVDGKVTGWGRNFYDNTIKIRKEIIRK